MVADDWKNYMIDVRLMKLIGLYQMLDPNTATRPFGRNVFKLVGAASVLYLAFVIAMCVVSIYYASHDFAEVVKYVMLTIASLLALIKMYFVVRNSDRLWELMSFSCVDFLPYRGHRKSILVDARAVSVRISKVITLGWTAIIVVWILSPIIIQGNYVDVKSEGGASYRRYRYNMMSLIFPVTAEFYNDNFSVFYSLETIALLVYGYSMTVFDCLVISMCLTITYQLKMVASSFSTLGRDGADTESKHGVKKLSKKEESSDFNNLLSIIQDHQILMKKMNDVYNVMRPIILFQLSVESMLITLQPFLTVLNLNRNLSLTSPDSIKLMSSALTNSIHLFTTCYLFTTIDKYKDLINFALYSSNWTEMNSKFKKLILLTMQVNNTENSKLKVTTNIVVNLELFTNVIHTTYKIISVLVKKYK